MRVDCDNFHEIREERLRSLAQRVAEEVRRQGRPRILEPMNPADRRIIHITLADDPGVVTESEGDGYFKRIMVRPGLPRPRRRHVPRGTSPAPVRLRSTWNMCSRETIPLPWPFSPSRYLPRRASPPRSPASPRSPWSPSRRRSLAHYQELARLESAAVPDRPGNARGDPGAPLRRVARRPSPPAARRPARGWISARGPDFPGWCSAARPAGARR